MKIKRFPLGALWTNCYLLWDETGEAVVIDPGGDPQEVLAFADSHCLKIQWVLLTHGHGDHLLGVDNIRSVAIHGVAIHAEDAACLTSADDNLSGHMGMPAEFAPADRILKEGDILSVGNMTIRVLHTPGHTVGGCCFLVTEGKEHLLISGDTLFARSVGRSDLPGGDEHVLMHSLHKLADLPDDTPVYPGHGPQTSIGEERKNNPFWPA